MALAIAGRRSDDRRLAHAAHAVRMGRIRHLDDDRVDHRQVQRRGHAIVEIAGVQHPVLVVEEVFLVQRPADALHAPALHLPFDVAGMDRLAGVLHGRVAQDRDLAVSGSTSTSTMCVPKPLLGPCGSTAARPTTGPPVCDSLPASSLNVIDLPLAL